MKYFFAVKKLNNRTCPPATTSPACSTTTGQSCVFPFTYNGVEHTACTLVIISHHFSKLKILTLLKPFSSRDRWITITRLLPGWKSTIYHFVFTEWFPNPLVFDPDRRFRKACDRQLRRLQRILSHGRGINNPFPILGGIFGHWHTSELMSTGDESPFLLVDTKSEGNQMNKCKIQILCVDFFLLNWFRLHCWTLLFFGWPNCFCIQWTQIQVACLADVGNLSWNCCM